MPLLKRDYKFRMPGKTETFYYSKTIGGQVGLTIRWNVNTHVKTFEVTITDGINSAVRLSQLAFYSSDLKRIVGLYWECRKDFEKIKALKKLTVFAKYRSSDYRVGAL